ncbi:glycoside hydrolase family 3 N-terminal domain-containing protein [Chryseosolibacter indicus]|uniref:Glycoside hydrolase family 3 C-terminal domain-containing protein n=1 Tax=Chryseosolibacter indicus TaxID=2782351 RepID=A0ABS5VRG4_9BACT|nr:glycoside hydrolase family 3 N-terminal domain-containing protein [Chryseosolibacter indicus]MBT1704038.1 glycoside hydrolase family 3 C-terminal domain-containing protein [Chryseosolibacter indicus]
MKRCLLLLLISMGYYSIKAQQITANDIPAIIGKLTVEEKVKLVVGAGMKMPGQGGTTVGSTEDKVPGAAGTSQSIERLGIAKVVMADGPAGVRIDPKRSSQADQTFYCTGFPVATSIASTFNTELMEKVGVAYGNEAKEYGVDIALAPALNIHRNPLGGRNFEYYSEDPVVSGKMAAAFVRGLQSQGVGATIKHFAANNQETNRNKINTIVSERALREIYLRNFEIAVKESQPWCVMSSYNKINEVFASESPELLTTILRKEWGFKGFVMTDWFGGESPAKQMLAGNDLLMPGTTKQEQDILNAIKDGSLSENVLNKNVEAILKVYSQTLTFRNYKPSYKPDLEAHKRVAKDAASEGMVLVKNENYTLPLKNAQSPIALLGIGSYETIAGGTGSGDVNKAYTVSIYEGLQKKGILLSEPLANYYQKYLKEEKAKIPPKQFFFEPDKIAPEMGFSDKQLDSLAEVSSVAVFTLTRTSGEFADRKLEADFNLTQVESDHLKKTAEAFHKRNKRFIVLLNIGGVIETASWKQYADAILITWQSGQEGGHAVADVLFGTVNPSGKLATTFPVNYEDVSSSKNFPGKELEAHTKEGGFAAFMGVKSEVVYEEDIFVGYRYFKTFGVPVSYPFGFGLSYSKFSLSNLKVSESKGDVKITCVIKNTGKSPGKEVAQVFIAAPKGNLIKPAKELKAFAKTKLLKPGEQQQLEFTLTSADLASFDASQSAWITEKGSYGILVGTSVADLPLKGKYDVKETKVVSKTNKVLVPARDINTLRTK